MTSEEIRTKPLVASPNSPPLPPGFWVRESAYQLALLNDQTKTIALWIYGWVLGNVIGWVIGLIWLAMVLTR